MLVATTAFLTLEVLAFGAPVVTVALAAFGDAAAAPAFTPAIFAAFPLPAALLAGAVLRAAATVAFAAAFVGADGALLVVACVAAAFVDIFFPSATVLGLARAGEVFTEDRVGLLAGVGRVDVFTPDFVDLVGGRRDGVVPVWSAAFLALTGAFVTEAAFVGAALLFDRAAALVGFFLGGICWPNL